MSDYTSEEIDSRIIAYLEGELPSIEMAEVEHLVSKHEVWHKKMDEFREVLGLMEQEADIKPPIAITQHFFDTLNEEKSKLEQAAQQPSRKAIALFKHNWWVQVAAAVFLFTSGFLIDKKIELEEVRTEEMASLKEEINKTKELMMFSMLQNPSASSRIKAVNFSYEMDGMDKKIVNALIETMNYDQSLNVRIAATEALFRFAKSPSVRMAMVQSLKLQDTPDMQIMLIDMLIELKENEALPIFQLLATQEGNLEIVRLKALKGMDVFMQPQEDKK